MIARKLGDYKAAFALAWRYAAGHKGSLISYVALAVFGSVTESVGVFLLVPLLETMGKSNIFASVPLLGSVSAAFDAIPESTRLLWAGGLMLVVVLVRGALQMVQEFLGYAVTHRIDLALRLKAFDALLRAPMQYSDRLSAGFLSDVTVGDPARIGIALRFIAMLVSNLGALAFYIAVLSVVSPLLLLLAAAYVAAASLLYKKLTTNLLIRVGHQLSEANRLFSQIFFETMNAGRLIRLSGAVDETRDQVKSALQTLEHARDKSVAVENMAAPFFSTLGGILICVLVFLTGLVNTATASKAIGLLVVFFVLLLRILGPLSIINIARSNIIVHLPAFREYDRFLTEVEQTHVTQGTITAAPLKSDIRLQNVSFSYDPSGTPTVSDIDLVIEKGQFVAFVGASGSGKSTIVNLISGLYQPSSGKVLIDGTDLTEIITPTWWKQLGVVIQEPLVFNTTVRDNIALGSGGRNVPLAQIREAAKFAAIDSWIESLPAHYETILGERGSRLSGGERQRVTIARAFVRHPAVLVFDEATSALDAATEATILKNVQTLLPQNTVLMITHRLEAIRNADVIVVMQGGRIVEKGKHADLLKRHGPYRKLLEARGPIEDNRAHVARQMNLV